MGRRLILCLLTAFLAVPGAIAPATPAPDENAGFSAATALFDAGKYKEAQILAGALNTPDGLALAARARLVLVRFSLPPDERRAAIEIALGDARRALVMDQTHLEANLQAAIALGYRAHLRRSTRDAWAGRSHIDQALRHHPESSWALAALGGWHGEVVLEAGRFFASTLFGAERRKAITHFRAAVAAEPGNIAVRASFATMLLRFNRPRFEAEALTILEESVALDTRDAFEELMMRRMRDLLQALREGQREKLEVLLESMAAFAG